MTKVYQALMMADGEEQPEVVCVAADTPIQAVTALEGYKNGRRRIGQLSLLEAEFMDARTLVCEEQSNACDGEVVGNIGGN